MFSHYLFLVMVAAVAAAVVVLRFQVEGDLH
jgi:hypothetical protein